jgi:hypothetical protein
VVSPENLRFFPEFVVFKKVPEIFICIYLKAPEIVLFLKFPNFLKVPEIMGWPLLVHLKKTDLGIRFRRKKVEKSSCSQKEELLLSFLAQIDS